MLKIAEWKKEHETLHLLAQILGKHKLASAFQEPQWAHVILDMNTTGFSTGLLFHYDCTYTINVDLQSHRLVVETGHGCDEMPLHEGTTIQDYYEWIQQTLKRFKVEVPINTTPQEWHIRPLLIVILNIIIIMKKLVMKCCI